MLPAVAATANSKASNPKSLRLLMTFSFSPTSMPRKKSNAHTSTVSTTPTNLKLRFLRSHPAAMPAAIMVMISNTCSSVYSFMCHLIRRKVDKKKWNDQIPDALFVSCLCFLCRFFRQDCKVVGFLQCAYNQWFNACVL